MMVCEIETIEKEFYLAYEVTQTYLGSIEYESSSVASVDSNENQESEVNFYHLNSSDSFPGENLQPGRAVSNATDQREASTHKQWSNEKTDFNIRHRFQAEHVNKSANEQQTIHSTVKNAAIRHGLNKYASPYCVCTTDYGQMRFCIDWNDLWKMKRRQMPFFSGNKRTYQSCLCARLFICALWSPAGKGLTSWLSFVVSNFKFVTFPLVSWVRCGT